MLTVPEMDQTEFTFEFDEKNHNWSSNDAHNQLFLKVTRNYANDKLTSSKAPLFLNEVLDMLGFSRIRAGQVLGWAPGSTVRFEPINDGFTLTLRIYVDGIVLPYL